ncbi:hypothetical protein ACNSZH_34290 [Burkholderia gladioli]|uniref:hypothetical protein n=1 Tax=Burkholderia gladioli TaxID=28095 RepID=UPI003B981FCD
MRQVMVAGALALLAGCSTVPLPGGWSGEPTFDTLQRACGEVQDYGVNGASVYAALYDAWVAKRHGKLDDAQFCAFSKQIAARHAGLGVQPDAAARAGWIDYLNTARAQAISWRSKVDPTLRGG